MRTKENNQEPKNNVPDLHVDPKGPNVEGVDGFPQPGGEVHPVETTPGPRQEAGWKGAVQRHLQQ